MNLAITDMITVLPKCQNWLLRWAHEQSECIGCIYLKGGNPLLRISFPWILVPLCQYLSILQGRLDLDIIYPGCAA